MPQHNRTKHIILSILLLSIVVAGSIVVFIVLKDDIWELANNPEKIKNWVEGYGPWGPIAFIGLQIIQVIIFIIPGEIPQVAGGMLFGIIGGLAYSTIGIALGST